MKSMNWHAANSHMLAAEQQETLQLLSCSTVKMLQVPRGQSQVLASAL